VSATSHGRGDEPIAWENRSYILIQVAYSFTSFRVDTLSQTPLVNEIRSRPKPGRSCRIPVRALAILPFFLIVACDSATAIVARPPAVVAPPPQEPVVPPPSPPSSDWNNTLSDTTILGDVIVPIGERWLIGPNVRISGNLRTEGGTIAMRPGSSLTFVGAQPEQYVGGGMSYKPDFVNDWGIWIGGTGILDIQGTPKVGWNRTGVDSTWAVGDELWIAPTEEGVFAPRRWNPGDAVPQVHPLIPAAEIINVTRDVVIEGPGHIHISSSVPQRIEYVTLRRMGIVSTANGATTGRYALHFHFQGEGSRGTIVRGAAAIESEGRVFVPHQSHGVTFIDNVSVNSFAEGFWWDPGEEHATHDIVVDRLLVCGVNAARTLTGVHPRWDAVTLAHGLRNRIDNSVACGASGGKLSNGFDWATGPSPMLVWNFGTGNVAHNNEGAGTRIWNNSKEDHRITVTAYNNGAAGVQNGAYNNSNRYTGALLIGNPILHNSSSNEHLLDGGPGRYTNVTVETSGPALIVGQRNLPAKSYQEFVDCRLAGTPKVFVQSGSNPWLARFIRCDVTPEDIVWQDSGDAGTVGSHVIIEHIDGRQWDVRVVAGTAEVTERTALVPPS